MATVSNFFHTCYAYPRDLHSFPTRRSSDLYAHLAKHEGDTTRAAEIAAALREDRADRSDRSRRIVDRKSTRLNSSHSQISYAVFCLKKKKTITPTINHLTSLSAIN